MTREKNGCCFLYFSRLGQNDAMITRFAPSPTGYLHLGHVLAAQRAFGFAKDAGGTCLLRIEDIDRTRCRPDYTRAIYEDLDWLGFDWPLPARVQSAHLGEYASALDTLKARGLVYPCFFTRRELADIQGDDDVYRGPGIVPDSGAVAAKMAAGEVPAWRLSIAAAKDALGAKFDALSYFEKGARVPANAAVHGDVILARKDIGTSYHLACTHDDALQGVTHVVRGRDLEDLTGLHVLLQTLMGWPVPDYHHHELLMKTAGEKLSKRGGDTSIKSMRETGMTAAQVLDMAMAGQIA